MARVLLAMSGGVDSSVAAWLLQQQGHEVVGLFMRHGVTGVGEQEPGARGQGLGARDHGLDVETDASCVFGSPPPAPSPQSLAPALKQGCCTATDAADARRVADRLGIPFYAVNFQEEFHRIIDYFVSEYTIGRTPNPCIMCNTWLKFGKLFEYADSLNADYVATGHYARIATDHSGAAALLRGQDAAKDQSYVLFGVDRRLLERLCLPIGEYRKEEIRRIAGQLGLRVAGKPDSQEICFVPDQDHARFIRQSRPETDTSGEIVTTDGTTVGRHDGLEKFTIGQRKGLGVAFGQPRYVVRLEPETRRVVVGTLEELSRHELTAAEANWLIDPPQAPLRCLVKIRYRSAALSATITPLTANRFRVTFDELCRGIAPGQAAVCYDGDRVLGGGWIE